MSTERSNSSWAIKLILAAILSFVLVGSLSSSCIQVVSGEYGLPPLSSDLSIPDDSINLEDFQFDLQDPQRRALRKEYLSEFRRAYPGTGPYDSKVIGGFCRRHTIPMGPRILAFAAIFWIVHITVNWFSRQHTGSVIDIGEK